MKQNKDRVGTNTAILKTDIKKWRDATIKIKEDYKELTEAEQSAFDMLNSYWKEHAFDKTKCRELIDAIKPESEKHGNNPDLRQALKEFASLCTYYYTRTEAEFDVLKKVLGDLAAATLRPPSPPPVSVKTPRRPSGPSRKDYGNGDYYIGETLNGQRHGHGKYFFANGDRDEGNWEHGQLNGQCTRVIDNCTECGEYRNNQRVGRGKIIPPDGRTFEGEWNSFGLHGQGEAHWPGGDWYRGEWVNGEITGQGAMYNPRFKRTDTGEFVNGARVGRGEMKWDDGERYEGTWDDSSGTMNGQGVFHHVDGRSQSGRWVEGRWVSDNPRRTRGRRSRTKRALRWAIRGVFIFGCYLLCRSCVKSCSGSGKSSSKTETVQIYRAQYKYPVLPA
jgi:hypothetical protein